MRIHAFLSADTVTLYLDTSGEPLYKRGFKQAAVEAPLKENLAAGILKLTGWKPGEEALCDPMCGSGTFLIEAAQMALDVAPGLGRHFAFERFKHFERDVWLPIRQAAEARRQAPRKLAIYGSDILEAQQRKTFVNPAQCRPGGLCGGGARGPAGPAGPGRGRRAGRQPALRCAAVGHGGAGGLLPELGDALKAHWTGWRCYFFSGDPALPKGVRLKASKRTPLFNGAIECRLFEYQMIAGSARKPKPSETTECRGASQRASQGLNGGRKCSERSRVATRSSRTAYGARTRDRSAQSLMRPFRRCLGSGCRRACPGRRGGS
jgi:putative N6-adenine-specific DNA methylase